MMFLKRKWMKNRHSSPMAAADTGNNPARECTTATLDQWFSRYIRLRDTDTNGICRCITCHTTGHPKEFDQGHFVHRDRWSVRYHEHNNAAQCKRCNSFEGGQQALMGIRLDERYGAGTAKMLLNIGKRSGKLKAYERYICCQEYKAWVARELVRTGLEPWWKKDK
jgi:hypothetical protein